MTCYLIALYIIMEFRGKLRIVVQKLGKFHPNSRHVPGIHEFPHRVPDLRFSWELLVKEGGCSACVTLNRDEARRMAKCLNDLAGGPDVSVSLRSE